MSTGLILDMEIPYRCWRGVFLPHMGMSPNHRQDREKRKGIVRSKKRQLEESLCSLISSKYMEYRYRLDRTTNYSRFQFTTSLVRPSIDPSCKKNEFYF